MSIAYLHSIASLVSLAIVAPEVHYTIHFVVTGAAPMNLYSLQSPVNNKYNNFQSSTDTIMQNNVKVHRTLYVAIKNIV